ncbi:MAG: hypothetical protein AUJ08_06055 [Thaumarchaeota archaeon 13_1_40CM_3_50_5]|nr:MAG: hypothetical protein AUJ08_06055 [Thaumarchaeota archaeon 13_1_40CM_3_50_5]
MLDSYPEGLFLKIDKITRIYYDLRKIERDGGSTSELRLLIGRVYDLLFSFTHHFSVVAKVHPGYRRFEKPIFEELALVNERLYENIEVSSDDAAELRRVTAFEYGLAEIKIAIEKIFGDSSQLLLERIIKALNQTTA